jgi:hypothetical protein
VVVTARNALKRSNRRDIQTPLLYTILIDLENTSDGLKKLISDRYMQQLCGALITTLQIALSDALAYLEAASHWYGQYEVLGTPIDRNTINIANNFYMHSMSCCQQCHDILEGALGHPDIQNI